MKKLFRCLLFAAAFLAGATIVFVAAAFFLHIDVFGIFVMSATRAVSVFGDHFPVLHTRFGDVQIKTKATPKGQTVDIACTDCQLANKLIGKDPLHTPQALLNGALIRKRFIGTIAVENLNVKLDVRWEDNNASGHFELPDTEISSLYHAVRTIVPEAEQATISGHLSGVGEFSWPKFHFLFDPRISDFAVQGLIPEEHYRGGRFTYKVEDMEGNRVDRESGEGSSEWMNLEQIGRLLPAAITAIEDRNFYQHAGYDVQNMLDASTDNKKKGKIKRGASTITQQLAKNLFLSDERTYSRKLRELLYAVEMERELGKRRILELYLNIVEWGPNIYGARAAAKVYFDKVPSELLPEEAAWLASVLRSPKKAYEHEFLRNSPNTTLISVALAHMGTLNEETRNLALSRPIRFARAQ